MFCLIYVMMQLFWLSYSMGAPMVNIINPRIISSWVFDYWLGLVGLH